MRAKTIFLLTAFIIIILTLFNSSNAYALKPKQIFGIQDQTDFEMFNTPEFIAMNVKANRYVTDWDTALKPGWGRDQADKWYNSVSQTNMKMLLSFGGFMRKAPTSSQYKKAVKASMKRWPLIKEYQAWNEANHPTQPATYKNPKRAATYGKILDSLCRKKCKTIPVTIVITRTRTHEKWLKKFLKYYKKTPKIWGIHTYGEANRFKDKELKFFLKKHRKGQVWITETGAWAQFASWPWDLERQAKATKHVFSQATKNSKRIKRLYWYEWEGTGPNVRWDSGLFSPGAIKRPAYDVALKARYSKK